MRRNVLHADIESGISRLCLTNVKITCYVCCVVRCLHRKSVVARIVVSVIDGTAEDSTVVTWTRLIEPSEKRVIDDITGTVQCHVRALCDRRVLGSTNQRRFNPYECTCIPSYQYDTTYAYTRLIYIQKKPLNTDMSNIKSKKFSTASICKYHVSVGYFILGGGKANS